MTRLPTPDVGLLMNAYGRLGARQGVAAQRKADIDNSQENARLALASEQLRQQQERQQRDAALSVARLYADSAANNIQNERLAAAPQSDMLQDQIAKRMQFGATASLTPAARALHDQRLSELQAILQQRAQSNRPWQYDGALAKWINVYDAHGIQHQVQPPSDPSSLMRPVVGPDGTTYGMGIYNPDGTLAKVVPTPKTQTTTPTSARQAFSSDSKVYKAYLDRAQAEYEAKYWSTAAADAKEPPPPSLPELQKRAGEMWDADQAYFNPPAASGASEEWRPGVGTGAPYRSPSAANASAPPVGQDYTGPQYTQELQVAPSQQSPPGPENIVPVTTPQEAASLPPGTYFRRPDGTVMRVPVR